MRVTAFALIIQLKHLQIANVLCRYLRKTAFILQKTVIYMQLITQSITPTVQRMLSYDLMEQFIHVSKGDHILRKCPKMLKHDKVAL